VVKLVLALAAGLNTKPSPHAKPVTLAGSALVSPQVGVKGAVVGACTPQAGQGSTWQHRVQLDGVWCRRDQLQVGARNVT
jgi:hypothetical protein